MNYAQRSGGVIASDQRERGNLVPQIRDCFVVLQIQDSSQ
jgi:hypothetical protein